MDGAAEVLQWQKHQVSQQASGSGTPSLTKQEGTEQSSVASSWQESQDVATPCVSPAVITPQMHVPALR